MEFSHWEATSCAPPRGILNILWDPKIHNRIHKVPPLAPDMSQLSPGHTPGSCFLEIIFNIILPSYVQVFLMNSPTDFLSKIPYLHTPLSSHAYKRRASFIYLDTIVPIMFNEENKRHSE